VAGHWPTAAQHNHRWRLAVGARPEAQPCNKRIAILTSPSLVKHDHALIVRNFARTGPDSHGESAEKLLIGVYICEDIMTFVMVRRRKKDICS
jgi:hypothetical protein